MSISIVNDVKRKPCGIFSTVPLQRASQANSSTPSRVATASNVVSRHVPIDDTSRCSGDHDVASPSNSGGGPAEIGDRGPASMRARELSVRTSDVLYRCGNGAGMPAPRAGNVPDQNVRCRHMRASALGTSLEVAKVMAKTTRFQLGRIAGIAIRAALV